MSLTKTVLPVLALFISCHLQAQFKKGDKMVGMSVGSFFFNSGSSEVSFPQTRGYSSHSSGYGLSIEPAIGWFISPNTAIGGSFIIKPGSQKIRYEDLGTTFQEDKVSNVNIGLGAFARHYFGTSTSWKPFAQAGFNTGINSASSEGFKFYNASPDYKISYDGKSSGGFFANAILQAGLTKMLSRYTGLDFYVGYNYSYNKNTFNTTTLTDLGLDGSIDSRSENETTTKFTNHGVIVAVGFQVFL